MKETLLYLVRQLVDHPEDVVIEETEAQDRHMLHIHTHPDDMGKVIGKSGRIIRAIRDLIKVLATKRAIYVDVEIAEDTH